MSFTFTEGLTFYLVSLAVWSLTAMIVGTILIIYVAGVIRSRWRRKRRLCNMTQLATTFTFFFYFITPLVAALVLIPPYIGFACDLANQVGVKSS